MTTVTSPGRNIVLIGLMGAGKSTVGRLVARRLGRPFVDTDAVVESTSGRAIAEIFGTDGERRFREMESAAVRQVAAVGGQVIAVGGGAVLDPSSTRLLRDTGELIWLDAPTPVLVTHLTRSAERGNRPLLGDPADLPLTIERLRAERHDVYQRAATTTLQTEGRPVEVLADAIVIWAGNQPGLLTREEPQ